MGVVRHIFFCLLLIPAWCVLCGVSAGYAPPPDAFQTLSRRETACRPAAFRSPDEGAVRLFRTARTSGTTAHSLRTLAGAACAPELLRGDFSCERNAVARSGIDGVLYRRLRSGTPVRAGPLG